MAQKLDLNIHIADEGDTIRVSNGTLSLNLNGDTAAMFRDCRSIYAADPGRDAAFLRGFFVAAILTTKEKQVDG